MLIQADPNNAAMSTTCVGYAAIDRDGIVLFEGRDASRDDAEAVVINGADPANGWVMPIGRIEDDVILKTWAAISPLDQALRALVDAEELVAAAKRRSATAVTTLRADGVSWTTIGASLGVSKQAAQQRFKS